MKDLSIFFFIKKRIHKNCFFPSDEFSRHGSVLNSQYHIHPCLFKKHSAFKKGKVQPLQLNVKKVQKFLEKVAKIVSYIVYCEVYCVNKIAM